MTATIPRTDSIRELATFWQSHDLTDFEDELEEVEPGVFQKSYVLGVPLTEDEHDAVKQEAAARGLETERLVHEWVKEKLHRG
jgi:predicted DNA binding CopG/RHH family protein